MKDTKDDWSLLREFAQSRSQDAFSALVARHAAMVYAACLRELRNSHDAEDAAQATFIVLAHKASSIRKGTVIAAWLYRTARFVSSRLSRANRRMRARDAAVSGQVRQRQERAMHLETFGDLDRAIERLGKQERAAILLRFFEQRSHEEVAGELGVSVEAAKKRVQRAIHRLRELMRTPGGSPMSEASALTLLSSAHQPIPAHIPRLIVDAVFSRAPSAGAGTVLAKGALTMMNIARAKLIVCCMVLAVAVGRVALWAAESEQTIPLPQMLVVEPSGKPVAGASIETAGMDQNVQAYETPAAGGLRTDSQGRFTVPDIKQKLWIVVKSDFGYAETDTDQLAKSRKITLQPWASIEGRVQIGKAKAAGKKISVIGLPSFDVHFLPNGVVASPVGHELSTVSDAEGHFSFPRVIPGDWIVARVPPMIGFQLMSVYPQVVTIPPGTRVNVTLGGAGRAVIGRAILPKGHDESLTFDSENYLAGQIARRAPQVNLPGVTRENYQAEFKKWVLSPAGKDYRLGFAYTYRFPITADGTFRVDDLPAGEYIVSLSAGMGSACKLTAFIIPDMPLGYDDHPLDLGDQQMTWLPAQPSQQAPAVTPNRTTPKLKE